MNSFNYGVFDVKGFNYTPSQSITPPPSSNTLRKLGKFWQIYTKKAWCCFFLLAYLAGSTFICGNYITKIVFILITRSFGKKWQQRKEHHVCYRVYSQKPGYAFRSGTKCVYFHFLKDENRNRWGKSSLKTEKEKWYWIYKNDYSCIKIAFQP